MTLSRFLCTRPKLRLNTLTKPRALTHKGGDCVIFNYTEKNDDFSRLGLFFQLTYSYYRRVLVLRLQISCIRYTILGYMRAICDPLVRCVTRVLYFINITACSRVSKILVNFFPFTRWKFLRTLLNAILGFRELTCRRCESPQLLSFEKRVFAREHYRLKD